MELRNLGLVDEDFEVPTSPDPEYVKCQELWAAVLRLGIIDAAHEHLTGGPATLWLSSKDTTPGSFEWICGVFDFNPETVRAQVKANIEKFRKFNVPNVEVEVRPSVAKKASPRSATGVVGNSRRTRKSAGAKYGAL